MVGLLDLTNCKLQIEIFQYEERYMSTLLVNTLHGNIVLQSEIKRALVFIGVIRIYLSALLL